MKGFVLATVLALVATFPLVSQAESGAFGVQIPAQTQEVSASAKGGYVAQSLSDTFHVQKLQSSNESAHSSNETASAEDTYDRDIYYALGVALDSDVVI